MIVVAIVGVLSALAIYGVTKYLRSSKTAEVRTALGQMAKDAMAAFNREPMSGAVLPTKVTAALANTLFGSRRPEGSGRRSRDQRKEVPVEHR